MSNKNSSTKSGSDGELIKELEEAMEEALENTTYGLGWETWGGGKASSWAPVKCECGQDKIAPDSDPFQHSMWCPKYKPRPGEKR